MSEKEMKEKRTFELYNDPEDKVWQLFVESTKPESEQVVRKKLYLTEKNKETGELEFYKTGYFFIDADKVRNKETPLIMYAVIGAKHKDKETVEPVYEYITENDLEKIEWVLVTEFEI